MRYFFAEYKNQILDVTKNGNDFGVEIEKGTPKIVACGCEKCPKCIFFDHKLEDCKMKEKYDWLYQTSK